MHDSGGGVLEALYLVASILFILSLQWMSQVKSARRGNWAGIAAMVVATGATLGFAHFTATGYMWVMAACLVLL